MAVGDEPVARHEGESRNHLYGRDRQLEAFCEMRNALILVTGGSGIGKSDFLTAARDLVNTEKFSSPEVAAARETPGILQRIILDLATKAVDGLITTESALERLGERLLHAAKKISKDHGTKLASAIVKELVTFAKSRLGEGVGQALYDFAKEIKDTETDLESLKSRITTAADPDVIAVAVDLTREVADLMPNRELILFIDGGERFSEGDLAQVAYLPEILPDNVRLILAISTQTAKIREKVTGLLTRGITEYPVSPLTVTDISYWAFQEGLQPEVAERVHKMTGGYPVFAPSAFRAIRDNRPLGDVAIAHTFDLETRAALREIDTGSATAARRLSAFIDPVPDGRSAGFLGLSIYQWGEVQERLVEAGIFTTQVAGEPWFHEQRRKSIWRSISDAERRDAASRAFTELKQALIRTRVVNPDIIIALADIATSVPDVITTESKAKEVAKASLDEIAVLAAVIELAEAAMPDEVLTVFGGPVLAHARSKFGLDADLTPALISLCSKDLLFQRTSDDASVVVPLLDPLAVYLAAGRAGRDLGRLPIPRLATNVFEAAIRWRLEPFTRCVYGVGVPSAAEINARLLAEERSSKPGQIIFTRGPSRNILVLQLNLGSEQLYYGAEFATADDRDQAMERAQALESKLFGHNVDLVREYIQPKTTVAARRFLIAAERVLDTRLGSPESRPSLGISTGIEIEDPKPALNLAEMFRIARSMCTEDERIAFDLLDRRRIAYLSSGEDLLTVEVFGNEDGVVDLENVLDPAGPRDFFRRGPYASFELDRALHIKPGERVGTTRYRSANSAYGVLDGLFDLCRRASNYNKFQESKRVAIERDSLPVLLNEAASRTYRDAQLLASVLPRTDKPVQPRHTYLNISYRKDDILDEVGRGLHATYAIAELKQGEPEAVTVQFANGENQGMQPTFLDEGESLRKAFNVPAQQNLSTWGQGDGISIIADMLGYYTSDIIFTHDQLE